MQLQNMFLTYKHQLDSIPQAPTILTQPLEHEQIPTSVLADHLSTTPAPAQEQPVMLPTTLFQASNIEPAVKETARKASSTIATGTP